MTRHPAARWSLNSGACTAESFPCVHISTAQTLEQMRFARALTSMLRLRACLFFFPHAVTKR